MDSDALKVFDFAAVCYESELKSMGQSQKVTLEELNLLRKKYQHDKQKWNKDRAELQAEVFELKTQSQKDTLEKLNLLRRKYQHDKQKWNKDRAELQAEVFELKTQLEKKPNSELISRRELFWSIDEMNKNDCSKLVKEVDSLQALTKKLKRKLAVEIESNKNNGRPFKKRKNKSKGSDEPEDSKSLKRKQVEDSIPDAPTSKVPKLNSCTTRPHNHGEKSVSKEVTILTNSMGFLESILNPCTTRAYTRSMARDKMSHGVQTQSIAKQPEVRIEPEVRESCTRKRKHDAPRFSTSSSKVPKLENASPHTTC